MNPALNNDEPDFDLETQLKNAADTHFPHIPEDIRKNTKPYPERYDLLKTNLGSKNDHLEMMSMLSALEKEIQEKTITDELYDKIILLNKHGKSHIESVIFHAGDLAKRIIGKKNRLSPFEIFTLLCAIQIHDIGNMYGRDDHTTSFKKDFEKCAKKSFITDPVLIKCIFDIAKVHGGKINGNSDTIEAADLRHKPPFLQKVIRQRLLAAILRFADELADDNARTLGFDFLKMPEYSKIYHAYSSSLHTVKIGYMKKEKANCVKLCYFMSIQEAFCNYKKIKKEKDGNYTVISLTLIREIIERTKKMERERRYCSRYFLPYIMLKQIDVDIEIDLGGLESTEKIEYTLKETGYPGESIELSLSIEDKITKLKEKHETLEVSNEKRQ